MLCRCADTGMLSEVRTGRVRNKEEAEIELKKFAIKYYFGCAHLYHHHHRCFCYYQKFVEIQLNIGCFLLN